MDTTSATATGEPTAGPAGAPSPRRRLLGDLLIREGLITTAQLADALRAQAESEAAGPLGEILVDQQVITPTQLRFVLDKYNKKYRLGDLLVETNAITEEQLEAALDHQKQTGLRIGDALLELNFLTEPQMRQALSRQLRVTFFDLDAAVIDPELTELISRDHAARRRVIPVSRFEGRLTVAMDDPGDVEGVEELEAATGCRIDVVTSTSAAFQRAFSRLYGEAPAPARLPESADVAPRPDPEALPALAELRAERDEAARALAALQVASEALRRDGERTVHALRELEKRHAETVRRLDELASAHTLLRQDYEAKTLALREQRQRYEALRRSRPDRGDDFDAVLRQLGPTPPDWRPRPR